MSLGPVAAALYAKLTGDSDLTKLLATSTSVYADQAPQGAGYPFVVFNQQSGPKIFSHVGLAFDNPLYLIKGVDKSDTASTVKANQIADRLEALLTDATLTITGRTLAYLRPEQAISYAETVEGRPVFHRGLLFRLYVT